MLEKDAKLTAVTLTIQLTYRPIPIDETVFTKIEVAFQMLSASVLNLMSGISATVLDF